MGAYLKYVTAMKYLKKMMSADKQILNCGLAQRKAKLMKKSFSSEHSRRGRIGYKHGLAHI
jgi:hypothetical protein